MRPRHRVSRAAIELIKRFEGYRRKAAQLPDGRWTIGYGHTLTAREGAEVTEEDAEALLLYDLIGISHAVNEQVFAPLTQNQFDALVSFCFSLGLDSFRQSQVLKRLNEGQTIQAACAMELWRKAEFEGERIVIDALVRRRAAEKLLFLTPMGDAWVAAPSAVLRPVVDAEARELIPSEAPVEVVTSLEGDTVVVSREGAEPAPAPLSPEPEPGETVRAAAEHVATRLATIFPEPGPEPEPEAVEEARPQADFAPPITTHVEPEPLPEPEEPEPVLREEPDILDAPLVHEPAPEPLGTFDLPPPPPFEDEPETIAEFVPVRAYLGERRSEPSIIFDLILAMLGLAFFSFGIAWFYGARPDPAGGFISPALVGGLAGLAGVGFLMVAVYRLLRRLSRASEQD